MHWSGWVRSRASYRADSSNSWSICSVRIPSGGWRAGRKESLVSQSFLLDCRVLPLRPIDSQQYGGAVPPSSALWKEKNLSSAESVLVSESLALQCSALEFLNPLSHIESGNTRHDVPRRSDKWNSFHLHQAFWTAFLKQYEAEISKLSPLQATFSLTEEARVCKHAEQSLRRVEDATLPPRVSLSSGSNK